MIPQMSDKTGISQRHDLHRQTANNN